MSENLSREDSSVIEELEQRCVCAADPDAHCVSCRAIDLITMQSNNATQDIRDFFKEGEAVAVAAQALLDELLQLSPPTTAPLNQSVQRLQQALAAHPSPAVPEGWKLVPVEPTIEMMEAGRKWAAVNQLGEVYRAMLSSSPPYKG
jgi:hypothetical protein